MDIVTLSSKYQVVIPRRVRELVGLKPGTKLQVISFDDRIELVPLRPVREMKGFLKGLHSSFQRDEEDRTWHSSATRNESKSQRRENQKTRPRKSI